MTEENLVISVNEAPYVSSESPTEDVKAYEQDCSVSNTMAQYVVRPDSSVV